MRKRSVPMSGHVDGPTERRAGMNPARRLHVLRLAWLSVFATGLAGCSKAHSEAAAARRSSGAASPHPSPRVLPPSTPSAFPLQLDAARRLLVDSSGHPFLLHGDSSWSLFVQLTREGVERYLDDRASRGFNALLVNLVEHKFSNDPPRNAYGIAPFLVPGDFSTPSEEYFAHVDWTVRRAAERGLLLLVVPAYAGYNGGPEGWYQDMVASGSAKMRGFGRFLGKRYAAATNILWVHGGDYNPPQKQLFNELAAGIRESDSRALFTAHCAPETSAADYWNGEGWLQINSVYTYLDVHEKALQAYARADRMPFFYIEGRYEGEAGEGSEQRVRLQAYQALLGGAAGQVFGNNPIWHFNGPGLFPTSLTWRAALNSPGSRSMTHLASLFRGKPWWKLVPDTDARLLETGQRSGRDRAVAAWAADGTFALLYMPSVRTVSVNVSLLAGPRVTARWYDPSTGSYTEVGGGPFPPDGARKFQPPGRNASEFGDWVLVLESIA